MVVVLAGCATGADNRVVGDANDDSTIDAPDAAPDACVPKAETCNKQDDDCDGKVDEGFSVGAACDGPDTDLCKEGTIACAADGTAFCTDATANNVERCNSFDDDCNGVVDDGFPVGQPCTQGLGACA